MLRDVIWRMLYLRRRFGSGARIVLSKIDVSEAFRPVSVLRAGPPVFGYSFREWVVRDRPLQFGWRSCLLYTSPSPRDLSTSRMPSSA